LLVIQRFALAARQTPIFPGEKKMAIKAIFNGQVVRLSVTSRKKWLAN